MTVPKSPQKSISVCQSRPLRASRDASMANTAPTRPSQIAASSRSKPGRLTPEAVAADSPTAVIQRFCDALIALMREARGLSFDQRYQRLAPVVEATYNLPLMCQVSVGGEWARLQPAQQQRLTEAFSRYTIAIYANRFDSYNGQRFDVEPAAVSNPNGAIVKTQLTRADGTRLALNYLMRQS